jgi:hypothetical protein
MENSKFKNILKDKDGNITGYLVDPSCDWVAEMNEAINGDNPTVWLNVNGKDMPRPIYNLIVCKRDVGIYNEGMRRDRFWKITPIKKYFGWHHRDNNLFHDYLSNLLDKILDDQNG